MINSKDNARMLLDEMIIDKSLKIKIHEEPAYSVTYQVLSYEPKFDKVTVLILDEVNSSSSQFTLYGAEVAARIYKRRKEVNKLNREVLK